MIDKSDPGKIHEVILVIIINTNEKYKLLS